MTPQPKLSFSPFLFSVRGLLLVLALGLIVLSPRPFLFPAFDQLCLRAAAKLSPLSYRSERVAVVELPPREVEHLRYEPAAAADTLALVEGLRGRSDAAGRQAQTLALT